MDPMKFLSNLAQGTPNAEDGLANILLWAVSIEGLVIAAMAGAWLKREISYRAESKELHDDYRAREATMIAVLTRTTDILDRVEKKLPAKGE
jgi:hypothetical protein